MEFLKNHYEKIILSVVLVGLVGAAGFLALESMGFRSMMTDTVAISPAPQKPPTSSRTNEFFEALTNARAPQEVDFEGGHKIFSPEKIIKNPVTEEVLVEGQVGPKNLQVKGIHAHALNLQQSIQTLRGRTTVSLKYLAEYELGSAATRWSKSMLKKDRLIRLSGVVSRTKGVELMVLSAPEEVAENTPAEKVESEIELVIGGGLPEKIRLQGEQIWKKDILFSADLYYPPTQQDYPGVRVGTPLYFAGDTNTIIQITESEVTLRASSNNKRTTVELQQAAVAP